MLHWFPLFAPKRKVYSKFKAILTLEDTVHGNEPGIESFPCTSCSAKVEAGIRESMKHTAPIPVCLRWESNRQFSKAQSCRSTLAGIRLERMRKLAPYPSEGESFFTCCELRSLAQKADSKAKENCFHGRERSESSKQQNSIHGLFQRYTVSNLDCMFSFNSSWGFKWRNFFEGW